MRNLVLLLALANVIFFAWNQWVAEPPSEGATRFRASDLGPTLELAPEPAGGAAADEAAGMAGRPIGPPADAAPDTDFPAAEPAAPASDRPAAETAEAAETAAAPAADVCISMGPFGSAETGEDVVARVRDLGGEAGLRSASEDVFLGHWVQIRNIPGREEANRQVAVLQEAGFEDAYPMPEDDGERTISLGLFSDEERAERLQQQALELGLDAEVVPQTREATTYWVDVRLDPGQDPEGFASVLGVDDIVTGPDAVCPP
ncbi:SPOR domain-containing protein [Lentisalinibacter orientalis]|uniref:SPOR domain-containing protein n=1 Tax=Lentisalinibacter orientalis TaxID=2992241 RepID=UPI003870C1CE